MAADGMLAMIGAVLAYFIMDSRVELYAPIYYLWVIPVFAGLWVCLFLFFGLYDSFRVKSTINVLTKVLQSAICGFIIFGCLIYLLRAEYVSRQLIVTAFALTTGLLALGRIILIFFLRYLRRKGFNFRNVIIVGTGKRAQKLMLELHMHRELGFRVVGIVDEDTQYHGKEIGGYKILGALKDLPDILRNHPVDQVIFVVPRTWLSIIEEAVLYCETLGVTVSIAVDLFKTKFTQARDENFIGVPMISFESTSTKVGQLLFKRIMDLMIAGVGLLFLSPLFLLIAILTKVTSPGPVFFTQERCSVNGRRFKLYKFRTMIIGAEAKLEELKEFNEMKGPAFKMRNDPRVTFLGKILRKTSLDELPQLWNVLKGEMSLVGPRPPLPKEVEQYDHWQRRRLSMRPGITCLWQVRGRNKITDFNEWMRLDLEYIDNWSLAFDFRILFQTIPVVLFGIGAK